MQEEIHQGSPRAQLIPAIQSNPAFSKGTGGLVHKTTVFFGLISSKSQDMQSYLLSRRKEIRFVSEIKTFFQNQNLQKKKKNIYIMQ